MYVNLINYMDRSTVAGMLEKIKTDKDFNIQKGQLCSVNHKNISKRKMYVQYRYVQ